MDATPPTQVVEPTVVQTKAGPIEVADIGTGPAVIVAHGMPGDWSQAAPLGQALATDNRVLLVSRPGYGRTPLDVGRTPRATAAAYASLLDTLGIERAAMMGISGGGPSAFEFAANERDRCIGLALCCAVNLDTRVVPTAMKVFHSVPVLPDLLMRLDRRRRQRQLADPAGLIERALEEANDVERARMEADPVAMEWVIEFVQHNLRVTQDMRPFRHDLRNILRHQRSGPALTWPAGPDVPTLLLHGDADPVVDIACAHDYARLIPGAQLELFEGGGHGFLFTFRTEATERLRTFLAGLAG